MASIYSLVTVLKGLEAHQAYKTKAEFPRGFTPKFRGFIDGVVKSYPYWVEDDKAKFKARVKQGFNTILFIDIKETLEGLAGVVTLKDVAKTTKNPDIFAELVRLSAGIESLRAELTKAFASKASEIETPKPKAKKAKAVVEEELFPL